MEAVVLPKVTSNLHLHPLPFDRWCHISDLQLADPDFGSPGSVDILLGIDVFSSVVLHGRRFGPPGSPSAFETHFRWVLAGVVDVESPQRHIVSYHTSILTGDDLRTSQVLGNRGARLREPLPLWTSALWWTTSVIPITVTDLEGSLFDCHGSQMRSLWESPDLLLSEGFSLSSIPYDPRDNLRNSLA